METTFEKSYSEEWTSSPNDKPETKLENAMPEGGEVKNPDSQEETGKNIK
jgi:hypothetical protein